MEKIIGQVSTTSGNSWKNFSFIFLILFQSFPSHWALAVTNQQDSPNQPTIMVHGGNHHQRQITGSEDPAQIIQLPNSIDAFYMMGTHQPRLVHHHQGFLRALKSAHRRHSHKTAYILLLGGKGSGKEEFAILGDRIHQHSTTGAAADPAAAGASINGGENRNRDEAGGIQKYRQIRQYTMSLPLVNLGLNNTAIQLIDVPEFASVMEEPFENSEILLGLESFLQTHPDLSHRIPNAVLIFSKYRQIISHKKVRLTMDHTADFLRMIDTVELFRDRILDGDLSNAIFICSKQQQSSSSLDDSRRVAEEASLEENLEDSVPADDVHAKLDLNHFLRLNSNPIVVMMNSTWSNIPSTLQRMAYMRGDGLGEAIFRNFFYTILPHHPAVSARRNDHFEKFVVQKRYLARWEDTRYTSYVKTLCAAFGYPKSSPAKINSAPNSSQDLVIAAVGESVAKSQLIDATPISQLLTRSFARSSPTEQRKHDPDFQFLKRILYLNNVTQLDQVPRTLTNVVDLFRQLSPVVVVDNGGFVLDILQSSLGMKVPFFNAPLVVGHGFDFVRNGLTLNKKLTPFDLTEESSRPTSIGFKIPRSILVHKNHQVLDQFDVYKDEEEYFRYKLKQVGLNQNLKMTAEILDGLRTSRSEDSGTNFFEDHSGPFVGIQEHRLFKLSLDIKLAQIIPQFERLVQSLPRYDAENFESVQIWKSFFTNWGTHIVTSAWGGGAIRLTHPHPSDDNPPPLPPPQIIADRGSNATNLTLDDLVLQKSLGIRRGLLELTHIFGPIKHQRRHQHQRLMDSGGGHNETVHPLAEFGLKFFGGDSEYRTAAEMAPSKVFFEEWSKSLNVHPTILSNDLTLVHMAEVIESISSETALEARMAFKAYISGTLKYTPPPPPTEPPYAKFEQFLSSTVRREDEWRQNLNDTLENLREGMNDGTSERENYARELKSVLAQMDNRTVAKFVAQKAEHSAEREILLKFMRDEKDWNRNYSLGIIAVLNGERNKFNEDMKFAMATLRNETVLNAAALRDMYDQIKAERLRHDGLVAQRDKGITQALIDCNQNTAKHIESLDKKTLDGQTHTLALITTFTQVIAAQEQRMGTLVNNLVGRDSSPASGARD